MWKQFKHKTVRDLAWCIYSERILDEPIAVDTALLNAEYLNFGEHLQELDKDPQILINFLATKNTRRLGHYYEQLVFYWLQHTERFDILASNMPVRTEKGLTKGEIDLIVYDKQQGLYEHWELAVKFYLAYQTNDETIYIGPNANDFLHLKLQKLIDKQCKILECDKGKQILTNLEIPYIQSKLLIKGFLFYHPKQTCIPWENIHANHARSWWIYLEESEEFLDSRHQFALIHKDEWLSTPTLPKKLLTKKECLSLLHQELMNRPRSIYLACYKYSELITQGFVVHNTWPKL